ncbi:MAG TPA: LysR substrate-binding domain-containing protein [Hyphomicrobiaceae bacterium]
MRLEWIEDILAILRAGSLSRAAEQRYLTQPAFSRRIRSIEEYLGVELVDRTRKPAQLRRSVLEKQQRLEELAEGLHNLLYELREQDRKIENRVTIASQHAITTSVAPTLVKRLSTDTDTHIRLRSANRDECFNLLVTRQADLTLTYRSPDEQLPLEGAYLEKCDLGEEQLIPVFATDALSALNDGYRAGELPVIAYPADVFLGEVMNREIFPKLRSQSFLRAKAETALTLAALQLALTGVGVAWVPRSLAAKDIAYGNLTELSHIFSKARLTIGAIRLAGSKSPAEQEVWNIIGGHTASSGEQTSAAIGEARADRCRITSAPAPSE